MISAAAATTNVREKKTSYFWLYLAFFFSGFPALVYQIIWQRALFTIYGVNIESVTIVVTAFMLGLGLGSLFGGWISSKKQAPLLIIFGLAELGIAIYGLISLRLFHWIALFTAGTTLFKTSFITFFLILIPTLLMGCTLPLLVAYMVRLSRNVGRSVGRLYFVNTLGSAVACFVSAGIMMRVLGQSGSVVVAALVNICLGISILALAVYSGNSLQHILPPQAKEIHPAFSAARYIPFRLALIIATLSGFIALGYEILWYRVFSYTTGGLASSFAFLLGSYLAGIAFGSRIAEAFCTKYVDEKARYGMGLIAVFVIAANIVGFLVIPSLVYASLWLKYGFILPLVGLAAAFLGAIFPFIAHASIRPDSDSGIKLSYLYLSNILGSAAGSFFVGFILMDVWPLSTIALSLALIGILLGTALLVSRMPSRKLVPLLAGGAMLALVILLVTPPLFSNIYEKLCFKSSWNLQSKTRWFQHVIETKSGVVTSTRDGRVYGNGSLEARLITDRNNETTFNYMMLPLSLSSFHPNPRKVLMIGLCSGSWAEIVSNHPQLEKLTVIDINAGYIKLVSQYPEGSELLKNPKVHIVIDDGRRWLLRNPGEKFDLLIMDTPDYRRDHISTLLSVEFLQLARQHLNQGGILYYNTTYSPRALLTGASVFPYALRISIFLAVSDSPIEVNIERWKNVLLHYRLGDEPVFNMETPRDRARLERVLSLANIRPGRWIDMEYADQIRREYADLRIITDDNMGDEWLTIRPI
jgi:spermidine synthase